MQSQIIQTIHSIGVLYIACMQLIINTKCAKVKCSNPTSVKALISIVRLHTHFVLLVSSGFSHVSCEKKSPAHAALSLTRLAMHYSLDYQSLKIISCHAMVYLITLMKTDRLMKKEIW